LPALTRAAVVIHSALDESRGDPVVMAAMLTGAAQMLGGGGDDELRGQVIALLNEAIEKLKRGWSPSRRRPVN
jgi:hypothetical protein